MKAVVYTSYGAPDVLQIKNVPKPVPKSDEILIKVKATTATTGDAVVRSSKFPAAFWLPARLMFGLFSPRKSILGTGFSGVVESVGESVTLYEAGDELFGSSGMDFGTYAQYLCVNKKAVMIHKSHQLSHAEAAPLCFGGLTALHFLKKAQIKTNQKVLVFGASGSVGSYAVQLAKYFGAEVTGVCSGQNLELVYSLGADHVIDYTKEDFTKNLNHYDVIFDTTGKSQFSPSVKALKEEGYYLLANAGFSQIMSSLWTGLTTSKTLVPGGIATETTEDLIYLEELIQTGKIRSIIDSTYPLEEMAQAHEYVDQGHKKGNVVISVD